MSTSIKRIGTVEYLYFSYYDRVSKRAKHKSCGVAGTKDAIKKCAEYECVYLENKSSELLGELHKAQNRLSEFDTRAKQQNKKQKTAVVKAQNFDTLQLAKRIKLERPDIHYKSSTNMAEVQDGSVQLVVTSPPYNVGKEYADHNDSMENRQYFELLNDVWKECIRVLCDGGRMAVNVADTYRSPYIPLHSFITHQLLDLGMLMRGIVYWDKGASVGISTAWGSWRSASNPTLRDVGEYIMIFSKGDFKLHSKNKISTITSAEFTQYTKSIWSFPTANSKRENHPAPFPDDLPARLIKLYTFLGDTVLDPFLGSGTTAKMAAALGRKAIGYEIDKSYAPLIKKKIDGVSETNIPLDSFVVNGSKPQKLDALYPSINSSTSRTNTST